jgi:hypothetical protein
VAIRGKRQASDWPVSPRREWSTCQTIKTTGHCSCYVCNAKLIIYVQLMANRRNLASSFDEIRTGLQARTVLDVLVKERSANSRLLDTWLVAVGLSASRQAISDLLDRLEKEGLVRLETVDDFKVVHLRRLGGEVASGHEIPDWIARPELPE